MITGNETGAAATGHGVWFRHLSILYLILAVLGPWISTGAVRGVRPEELLLPAMALAYVAGTGFQLRITRPVRYVLTGLAAVAAGICCSLLASMTRVGEGPVIRDMSELIRVAKYALVLILATYDVGTAAACRKWYVYLMFIAAGIAFVQALAPSEWVFRVMTAVDPGSAHFYARQNAAAGLLRVTGMFSNPNNFGVFLATGAGLLLGRFLHTGNGRERWLLGVGLTTVSGAVMLTQSFTGLVALGSVFLAGFLAAVFRRRYRRQALILLLTVMIVVGMFVIVESTIGSGVVVIGKRVTTAKYAFETMAGRFRVWVRVIANIADEPSTVIFGMGPHKETEEQVSGGDIDSEYVMILKRYGLIGSLLFAVFVAFTVVALRPSMVPGTTAADGWCLGALLMLLAIAVCGMTNVVYVNNQLMDIFMFLLGGILTGNRDTVRRSEQVAVS